MRAENKKEKQMKVKKATKSTKHVPPKLRNEHQTKAETSRHPKEHCPMSLAVLRWLEANNFTTVAEELRAQLKLDKNEIPHLAGYTLQLVSSAKSLSTRQEFRSSTIVESGKPQFTKSKKIQQPVASNKSSSSSSSSDSSDSEDISDKDDVEILPNKKFQTKTRRKSSHDQDTKAGKGGGEEDDASVSDVEVSEVSSVSTDTSSSSEDDTDDDSDSSSSQDNEDNKQKIHAEQKALMMQSKAEAATVAALSWTPKSSFKVAVKDVTVEPGTDGAQALSSGKPFQRVDDKFWGEVAVKEGGAIADNSYEGTFGETGYGTKASEKLLQVRGKRFQHEKTKRKRSFNGFSKQGGQINLQSFSTKFKYSDDET